MVETPSSFFLVSASSWASSAASPSAVRPPGLAQLMLGLGRDSGLVSGEGGLKASGVAETPNSVLLAGEFLVIFGGSAVGSIVLTLLMLGLGRDDGLVGGKGGLKVGVMAGTPSSVLLAGETPGILCAFPAVSAQRTSARRGSWLPPGRGQGGGGGAALREVRGAPARVARRAQRPVRRVCRITSGVLASAGHTNTPHGAHRRRRGSQDINTGEAGRPSDRCDGTLLQLGGWPAHRHLAAPSAPLAVVTGSRTRCEPSSPSSAARGSPTSQPGRVGRLGRASRPALAEDDLLAIILSIRADRSSGTSASPCPRTITWACTPRALRLNRAARVILGIYAGHSSKTCASFPATSSWPRAPGHPRRLLQWQQDDANRLRALAAD